MAEIRRCVTYQGSSVSKKNAKLNISHFHTAVSHETDSVLQEDIHTSDVDSPLKRISRNVERKKDKEVSQFLKFTMADDDEEDARAKMRKRQRLKTESDFNLYTRAVSYSRQKVLKKAFDSRFKPNYVPGRQTGVITLSQIMGRKESQHLIDQNKNTRDNYITEQFLNDPELREKTLQKALLFERFYDVQREELQELAAKTTPSKSGISRSFHSKNTKQPTNDNEEENTKGSKNSKSKTSTANSQVPKRFKSINPRHMRITTEGAYTEENFRRRKYIETKTRLQYFSKAMKVMEEDVHNRRRQNADLINMLVEINLNQRVEKPHYRDESRLLKRLYLHYSNHQGDDPASLYTHVPLERVKQLVTDFMPELEQSEVNRLYEKMKPINIFKLYELIHSFCRIIYGSSRKQLVSQLLQERIQPKRELFLDPIWQELEQNQSEVMLLRRSDRRVEQAIWQLFRRGIKDALNKEAISFSEVFETLWEFNIFPNHLAKSKIRYFYEYCCLEDDGLLFEEFRELIDGICLYIERQSPELKTREKILKVYASYNYFEQQHKH